MSFRVNQLLYEYEIQPWSRVRQAILELAKVGRQFGKIDNEDNLWVLITKLDNRLLTIEVDSSSELLAVQKYSIGLLDTDLVEKCIQGMNSLNTLFGGSIPVLQAVDYLNYTTHLDNLELNDVSLRSWSTGFMNLPDEEKNEVQRSIADISRDLASLNFQLYHIVVVLNLTNEYYQPYSSDEFEKTLVDNQLVDYDQFRLIRALVEGLFNEENHELVRIITKILQMNAFTDQKEYSWDEVLMLSLMLNVVFQRFERLPDEVQEFYLKYYCHRAIVVGVPVRKSLEQILYLTRNVFSYVVANKNFSEALSNSEEIIFFQPEDGVDRKLKDIILQLKNSSARMETDDGFGLNIFVSNLFEGKKHKDQRSLWLREFIYIYNHTKEADLVDHNRGGELTPAQKYENELIRLLTWFGIGKDGADDLVYYFKSKDESHISLVSFLKRLMENLDLKQEVSVENCMEVSDAFHKAGLLPPECDFIEFSADDMQFHWSDWIKKY